MLHRRLRAKFRHATHSVMVAFSISVGASTGHTRAQPAPVAPQPFTTLPVRAMPTPVIGAEIRNAESTVARDLTDGEKKLLRTLFGERLSLDTLQLVFDRPSLHPSNDESAAQLHVHETRFYSKDYSKEINPELFGYFINRMTGLLQQTSGAAWAADASVTDSMYVVDGRKFEQYGAAQQRAIVEDYALRFLHTSRQSYWLNRVYNGDHSITDPYLIAAVETTFPTAKKGRLDYQQIVTRQLTAREKEIIAGIFGSQLNTDIVRMHLSPLGYKDVAGAVASERDVYIYGRNRRNDFGRESSDDLGIFIHEMTHVWQFQTKRQHTVVISDQYKYTLEAGARFQDYNIEQQAAMIEDYLLYTLNKDHDVRWLAESYAKAEIPARTPHLLAAVETFFPTAQAWRLANQATPDVVAPTPAAAKPVL